MVLIISRQEDQSTSDVIDWLLYFNEDVIRINENDKLNSINLQITDEEKKNNLKFGEKNVILSQIKSFWFRRGRIEMDFPIINGNNEFYYFVRNHSLNELKTLEEFIIKEMEKKFFLGNYFNGNVNKLYSLNVARQIGLKIPHTFVTSEKESLLNFFNEQKNCISKSIQDVLSFTTQTENYYSITQKVIKSDILEMNSFFSPSLIQNEISKKYEIRIFYIYEACYAMAIFSQENEKSRIDFRNVDNLNPCRRVPYKLPLEIEQKICLLMNELGLNTGSIDMIFTTELEYIFLEVNPVGQYDMVSVPCNYYLHEKIAIKLKNGKKDIC